MSDEIAKCARCRQAPEPHGNDGRYFCVTDDCTHLVAYPDIWNEEQARILAARRKDFEAGVLRSTVFKLGHGELLPSELLERIWNDYIGRAREGTEP